MSSTGLQIVCEHCASAGVPFKDWNDIVRAKGIPDMNYQATLRCRESVKKGKPVFDARLTPIEAVSGEIA